MDANELADRVARAMLAGEGTGPSWGVKIEETREDYVRISMVVRADMLNSHGMAHGGMIFALADTAFAYACNSRNVNTVAQSATVVFVAPGREGDRLVAEAQEESQIGRSGVYAVKVRNQNGEIIAVFQGLSRSIGGLVLPEN